LWAANPVASTIASRSWWTPSAVRSPVSVTSAIGSLTKLAFGLAIRR
jgi:hypothetical protein